MTRRQVARNAKKAVAKKTAKAPAKKTAKKAVAKKAATKKPKVLTSRDAAPPYKEPEFKPTHAEHRIGKAEEPSADVLAMIQGEKDAPIPEDKLDAVRKAAAEVVVNQVRLVELAEETSRVKATIANLQKEKLPELMDLAGTPKTTVSRKDNYPAMELEVKPFFSANIAAGWEDEKKEEAYSYLEEIGSGTIIKTELIITYDKTDHAKALKLATELRKKKVPVTIKNSVHMQTLTAWLRDQVTRVKKTPDLEKIGGYVGREVKIKVLEG